MSEVKRYDCGNGNKPFCNGCYQMEETPYGDWISVDDFDKSQAEVEKLKQDSRNYLHEVEQLKAELTELKGALDDAGTNCQRWYLEAVKRGQELAALKAQEPVAWVEWCDNVCGVNWWPSGLERLPHLTKLYAAPQPSNEVQAEILQIKAENETLRTDAARYRFVRKLENDCWMLNTLQCVSESELDAAIDAAMEGDK